MENETVSVIVPVYNAERFLKKCITSILMQTYSDLEIILIDDGSTDRSLEICQRFAKMDHRITVLAQENKGVSAARNLGIDTMTGKYVTFVDADDWMPRNAVEILLREMQEKQAQYVVGRMRRIAPLYSSIDQTNNISIDEATSSKNNIDFFLDIAYFAHPVKKLYVGRIILDNYIRFNELIKYGEDCCFVLDYLFYCRKICSTSQIVYFYNKLYENTASAKYYIERHIWAEIKLNKFRKCANKYLSSEDAHWVLSKEAIKDICGIIYSHMSSNNNINDKIQLIRDTFELLSPFVSNKYISENESEHNVIDYKNLEVLVMKNSIGENNLPFANTNKNVGRVKRLIKKTVIQIKYLWIFRIHIKSMI